MTNHTAPSIPQSFELRGDETELYEQLALRLFHVVRRSVIAPDALIEDACSYSWIQMLRRQPDREYLFGWLRTTAVREAWTLGARESLIRSLDNDLKVDGDGMTVVDLVPAIDLDLQIDARAALKAVSDLRPLHQRTFARHIAGLSYTEIAAEQGLSARQVDRHIKRARRAIRDEMVAAA